MQDSHHAQRSKIILGNILPANLSENDFQAWSAEHQAKIDAIDSQFMITFRRLRRFSFILLTFTLVESNLSAMAQEIVRRNQLMLDLEDIQAKDLVKRFQKFWTKVAHLVWWENPRWDLLKNIEELRNCIAHRNGVTRKNDARIHGMVRTNVGIRLANMDDPLSDWADEGTVEIEARFCTDAIEQMAGLFKELFDRAGCFGSPTMTLES